MNDTLEQKRQSRIEALLHPKEQTLADLLGSAGEGMMLHDDLPEGFTDSGKWKCKFVINKYDVETDDEGNLADGTQFDPANHKPYQTVEVHKNLLMYGGVSCLWQCLMGNGTATAGQALTFFNTTQSAVGVGDSSTAAAATQTDLQAASNKLRVAMSSGSFPSQTDGVVVAANTITFQGTFLTAQANYAWQEVAVFNSTTGGTGRMLQRLVQSFGTKASGTWTMSVAITIT